MQGLNRSKIKVKIKSGGSDKLRHQLLSFCIVYYTNCYNYAQERKVMLLKILLKTLKYKQTNKNTTFNHNKCHACVQNDIPPCICKTKKTKQKKTTILQTHKRNVEERKGTTTKSRRGNWKTKYRSECARSAPTLIAKGYAPAETKQAHRQRATNTNIQKKRKPYTY